MISCIYCGEQHRTPSEVRECWKRSHRPQDAGGGGATHAPTASDRHDEEPDLADLDGAYQDGAHRGAADPDDHVGDGERQQSTHPTDANQSAAAHSAPTPSGVSSGASPVDQPRLIDQRGPVELGRNALVEPGQEAPAGWDGVARRRIGPAELVDPEPVVVELRSARTRGTALVFELDPALAGHFGPLQRPRQTENAPVHTLDPSFTFWLDELHDLVFRNSFDGRGGVAPATEAPPVWVDRGPLRVVPPVGGVPVVHAVQPDHNATPIGNSPAADLAEDQLAAVTHNAGSARIIAPAGSGKTRVLTERVRHLITNWRVPAAAICLLAFNRRAQIEMEQRTADLRGLQVRTLNSLALAIANGVPPFAPQPRRLTTITEVDVRRLLERFVKRQRRLNVDPLAIWIDALSAVRLGLRDPDEVEADYGGDVAGLREVYPQYVATLRERGEVDFDQQIIAAIEVLLTDPDARYRAQAVCEVLLVDEFQDLTPAHLLLIRLLAGPHGSVFGVGDDDQTIYGYNGADPAWLIEFAHWFPGAGDHPLEVNYRCPVGIVEGADRLLRHNVHRVAKTIRPAPGAAEGGWTASSSDDPVADAVAAVNTAIDDGAAPGDVAVLTRVNTTLAPVQVALSIAGIPISGGVGPDYAERTAIRAAFAWLRLATADRLDPSDLHEALRRPSRKLHTRVRDWASEHRDIDGLRGLVARLNNDKEKAGVETFADDLERLRGMAQRQVGTSALLRHLIDEIGLGAAVSTLDGGRRGTNRSAQNDDLQAFTQLADLYDRLGSGPFEPWLRQHLDVRRHDDGVVLSTVHRVKGQEWPHVIVHLADDDQYPHRLSENDEEERRLFHVAITRASATAVVTSGRHPSPFVAELTTEPSPRPSSPPTRASRAERTSTRKESKRTSASGGKGEPPHPLADRTTVIAAPGITLVDQGQDWTIVEVDDDGALAQHGKATRRFERGARVETTGRQRGTLTPIPEGLGMASVRSFDALRSFREVARKGKPPYVVFDDKTLAAIAEALPADTAELAAISGVGPAKLEAYGDAVLDIIAEADGWEAG